MKNKLLKATKIFGITLLILTLLITSARLIGSSINKLTPKGGINKSMYVEINGSKQWINIYGQDIDNPVMLYIHGGPGFATTYMDYYALRKYSDIYTVVTWNQRATGKSLETSSGTPITTDLMISDGVELTKFICDYMDKDKITILGHSWGSMLGSLLALNYPEYYDCYIGVGQCVNVSKESLYIAEAAKDFVVAGDKEDEALYAEIVNNKYQKYDPSDDSENSPHRRYYRAKWAFVNKHKLDAFHDNTDYNLFTVMLFNPNCTIKDYFNLFTSMDGKWMGKEYSDFHINSFNIENSYEYKIPYYNICGEHDFYCPNKAAEEYFPKVVAPKKGYYTIKNGNHSLLLAQTEEVSKIIHKIYTEIH